MSDAQHNDGKGKASMMSGNQGDDKKADERKRPEAEVDDDIESAPKRISKQHDAGQKGDASDSSDKQDVNAFRDSYGRPLRLETIVKYKGNPTPSGFLVSSPHLPRFRALIEIIDIYNRWVCPRCTFVKSKNKDVFEYCSLFGADVPSIPEEYRRVDPHLEESPKYWIEWKDTLERLSEALGKEGEEGLSGKHVACFWNPPDARECLRRWHADGEVVWCGYQRTSVEFENKSRSLSDISAAQLETMELDLMKRQVIARRREALWVCWTCSISLRGWDSKDPAFKTYLVSACIGHRVRNCYRSVEVILPNKEIEQRLCFINCFYDNMVDEKKPSYKCIKTDP
ncbi:hypothetical protein M011DRAFT_76870 [Sporormia fimetaria CBS 119925]|uniref:Uncharacterized protein n=1 Tax=Sporormia fimetaria CBS 119925 TaxID=1340428 RepID=A0A6A6VC42_9PLEO|nr:hypothetical protein M011DRAFT_76870 [Sporormia fimetaria CBS 119925]